MNSKQSFKVFIKETLKLAKIGQEYRDILTNDDNIKTFEYAFTDPSFDPVNNLQVLEFIGDGIIKGVNSQYIPRRFPDLIKTEAEKGKTGEGVLSKIRRQLEQKKSLSDFALKLGFWDYVKASEEVLTKDRKKTLEDVFEAFVGALVEVVDKNVKKGMGYMFAQNFVESQLDTLEISVSVEALDDPVTRLNELYKASFLKNNHPALKWGDAQYEFQTVTVPKVSSIPSGGDFKVGDMIFSDKEKIVYVFNGNKWVHINASPLLKLQPAAYLMPANPDDPLNDDYLQRNLWHAWVYGYPGGQKTVIGQGVYLIKMKDANSAKMMAARQALSYLKASGIEKDYTKKAPAPEKH